MNGGVVPDEGKSIDFVVCGEEEQSLSTIIQVGRKIEDRQDEDYVPWENASMEKQPIVDEHVLCGY